MGVSRGFEASEPLRAQPVGRLAGTGEVRLAARSLVVASGTLACPACDVPVLAAGALRPADALACGFCAHAGAVRDFLSLASPSRPARVEVRIVNGSARLVSR